MTDQQEESLELFVSEKLPHGSGIDCDWTTNENKTYWLFSNSYHCMEDSGIYNGYQDFTIKVLKTDFEAENWEQIGIDFVLQFNGRQYLAQKHQLRDYLEDTIYYSITM